MSSIFPDVEEWKKKGKDRYKPKYKGKKVGSFEELEAQIHQHKEEDETWYMPGMFDPKGKEGFQITQIKGDKKKARKELKKWMKKQKKKKSDK